MTRLDATVTPLAAADLHLVAADLGRSGCRQVLLPLASDPLHDQRTTAVRAGIRQSHRHHPVDPLGHRPPPLLPVGRPRLAARPPGMQAESALGERRGLALARPPQLLDLGFQLPDTSLEPPGLAGDPLDLAGELVALSPQRLALGLHHHDPLTQPAHRLELPASPPTLHRCHRGANHTTLTSRIKDPLSQ
jgi:hypothetical protein